MSQNLLQQYFPLLRTREEVLAQIRGTDELKERFMSWDPVMRDEFLAMCSGMRGPKITYDSFFKEAFNPEYDKAPLEDFLSHLLAREVTIKHVLPNDSVRVADETSTVIMDIVAEFDDGSITNIEIQKIGYTFPGERSACYSADLLLRQYRRIRDQKKADFRYTDIHPVYTIVLFENSPSSFHNFPEDYLHYFEQKSDTGLEVQLLQKFLFIPLDIFKSTQENIDKSIEDKTQAWLTFLCRDEPEYIIKLIQRWPEYKIMYDRVYQLCRNMEAVMSIFSEELLELDRREFRSMMEEFRANAEEYKKKTEEYKEEAEKNREEAEKSREEAAKLKLKNEAKSELLIEILGQEGTSPDIKKKIEDLLRNTD